MKHSGRFYMGNYSEAHVNAVVTMITAYCPMISTMEAKNK
jgi:hypothetical protein